MSDYFNYCQTPRSSLPPYPHSEVHFHHIHTQKFTSTISTLRSSLPPYPHSEVHFHHIHTQKFTSTISTLRSSLPPYPHSEVHFHHIHTQKFTSTISTLRSSLPPYPHCSSPHTSMFTLLNRTGRNNYFGRTLHYSKKRNHWFSYFAKTLKKQIYVLKTSNTLAKFISHS